MALPPSVAWLSQKPRERAGSSQPVVLVVDESAPRRASAGAALKELSGRVLQAGNVADARSVLSGIVPNAVLIEVDSARPAALALARHVREGEFHAGTALVALSSSFHEQDQLAEAGFELLLSHVWDAVTLGALAIAVGLPRRQ